MSSIIQEADVSGKIVKKRIFVGLLLGSLFLLAAVVALAWWIVSRPTLYFNKIILTIIIAGAIIFFALLVVGLLGLIWSLWRAKEMSSLQSIMHTATSVLFPVALCLGKWFGLEEEKIKNSFIQVSNQLMRTKTRAQSLKKVLILAPHCLQWIHCPHKITINVNNCRNCGQCSIADLIKLSQKLETQFEVVTGGTMARKVIKEGRPQAVVAIACERDLTSGIQDVSGLPVIGIVNERPEGPCANTQVDLKKVEEAIMFFRKLNRSKEDV
jgi:hypothetical protein